MADIPTLHIPIAADEHGVIRVGNTRVTLDTIIARYRQGDTPEAIHEGFPTISVSDIYAMIAYYLAHQEELDAYLARRQATGEALRREIEAGYSPEIKAHEAKLRALRAQKRDFADQVRFIPLQ
ncbi:MAG: DUF433 domain-containing protein [Anaerolinea sp.]|nr:DUF433 domain-containing protein [Anaerolinea sp.]